MKRYSSCLLITIFFVVISILITPDNSQAIPAFARQTSESCSACHYAFPKLNDRGIEFRYNGYRFKADEGEDIWLLDTVPVGFIIEGEGVADWGDIPSKQDLKVEEIELLFAAPIGTRFSAFGEIEIDGDAGAIGETMGRIQLDNITGKGNLNLAVGDIDVDFPHLSPVRKIIHQAYMSDKIGHLPGVVAVELNGQTLTKGPVSSYRYNAGVARDAGINGSNKFASGYGTLTIGVQDHYIGLQYRYAKEDQGATYDVDVNRIAANTEINFEPITLTAAYFYANYDEYVGPATDELKANNYMGEVLYKPADNIVLGVRGDYLEAEQGAAEGDITAISANTTYYFLSNFYLGLEYRNVKYDTVDTFGFQPSSLDDPTDGTENKIRAFLVAGF